ncbi:MAG TPA: hypothetical protein VMV90_09610 [Rectinemataceae bacterium]|nr:hypothetical protein [Rectinemataceae bacterium]
MARTKKEILVENLLVACAMGLLALLVAGVIFVAKSGSIARERSVLSDLAGRPVAAQPVAIDDPSIRRLYRLLGQGPALFGAVIDLDSRSGSAVVAAVVAADGQIQSIRLIDISSPRAPFAAAAWFANFIGRGGDRPFPSRVDAQNIAVVSGATESYLETGAALGRLSVAVRALAGEKS